MRKVEQALTAVAGVVSARANLSARRVATVHRATGVNSVDLVEALDRIGFKAAEIADDSEASAKAPDQALLRRVGVAGFAAANIMLLSVSVWSGAGGDMSPSIQAIFHWLSALIALPVVGYAGQPFFRFGGAGVARRAPQHGRTDLARRLAGDAHEPVPDHARQRAGLLRCRRHAAVLPAGRTLPGPAHAHARGRCRGQSARLAGIGRDRAAAGWRHGAAPGPSAGARHAHPDGARRALRCRRPAAAGHAARSTPV